MTQSTYNYIGSVVKLGKSDRARATNLSMPNSTTQFKKGQMPWNKGMKGVRVSPQTEFKKGENLGSANSSWKGGQVEKTCIECSKTFLVYPYRKNNAFFCSKKCTNQSSVRGEKIRQTHKKVGIRPLINGHHPWLGKRRSIQTIMKLRVANTGKKHTLATRLKRGASIRKTNALLGRGLMTKAIDSLRQSIAMTEWRKTIFTIDNYTCQHCGQVGGKFHIDHIIPLSFLMDKLKFEQGPENLFEKALSYEPIWDISNGRVLCIECHKETDTYLSGAKVYKTNNKII